MGEINLFRSFESIEPFALQMIHCFEAHETPQNIRSV